MLNAPTHQEKDVQQFGNYYDFIVAGAGSAGCVVASRLSENGRYGVLLLEAGGKDCSPWIHIPAGFAKTFTDPRVNWVSQSEPEPNLNDRIIMEARGKVLGGTSSINGMVYIRGNRADYDDWRRQYDCEGWDYQSVLPYFKKAENNECGASEFHGVAGPLCVSSPPGEKELATLLVKACMEAGIPHNSDFNGAQQDGAGVYQSTLRAGRRSSAATAYVRPARARKNLKVLTNAHATRIIFEQGRAIGIEFRTSQGQTTAYASREVIVSSGAFGSPQLLMLSGVGPAAHLNDMGISVVRDLPGVGANLQTHIATFCAWRINRHLSMNILHTSLMHRLVAGLQYVLYRGGPLAGSGIEAGAFVRSDRRLDRPDLQFVMTAFSTIARTRGKVVPHPFPTFGIQPIHLHPDSRGSVRLKSRDPMVQPEIRFNFLQSDSDLKTLIAGIHIARKIAGQPALKGLVVEEVRPGPEVRSEQELEADLRNRAGTNMHPAGTCAMGRGRDAVLDPRLRVHGITGLRVVDASIMPSVVGGNTNGPTIMIGEKAADMILADAAAV